MLSFNESPEEETSLWDNPINDTSGVLSINGQDNLVLYGKNTKLISPVWFTNVSVVSSASNSMAQLLNSGNLVLTQSNRHQSHGKVLIILPIPCFFLQHLDVWIGKLVNRFLTSWKSLNDLGTSDFTSVYFYYHIIK